MSDMTPIEQKDVANEPFSSKTKLNRDLDDDFEFISSGKSCSRLVIHWKY